MCQYKIIVRSLLILPIINFAFALPIVKETPQVGSDVVPGVAIIMPEKRVLDAMEEQWGMYFERLSGKPQSDLEGLKGLLHYGPEMTKTPSLDHYLTKSPSFDHYLTPPEPSSKFPPLDVSVVPAGSEAGPSRNTASSSMENPESKSFLSKVVSKLKFWHRNSHLVDIGTYVSTSSPESQMF